MKTTWIGELYVLVNIESPGRKKQRLLDRMKDDMKELGWRLENGKRQFGVATLEGNKSK